LAHYLCFLSNSPEKGMESEVQKHPWLGSSEVEGSWKRLQTAWSLRV
jgi:hypothetical protein